MDGYLFSLSTPKIQYITKVIFLSFAYGGMFFCCRCFHRLNHWWLVSTHKWHEFMSVSPVWCVDQMHTLHTGSFRGVNLSFPFVMSSHLNLPVNLCRNNISKGSAGSFVSSSCYSTELLIDPAERWWWWRLLAAVKSSIRWSCCSRGAAAWGSDAG